MPSRIAPLFVLIMILTSGVPQADVIEIPLPGLVGDYAGTTARTRDAPVGRTVSFDLGGRVTQVNGAWIRWSGSVAAGWGVCLGNPFRWAGTLIAYLDEPAFAAWRAGVGIQYPDWEFDFDRTQAFETLGDPGWDFLSDGTGEITVRMMPALYFCGEMGTPPVATLDQATLVLDVDLEPVAVESTTWGRVKALYRSDR